MSRISGHTLTSEGAAHDDNGGLSWLDGRHSGPGRGKCSCGELSEWLLSGSQRRTWHRAHKAEVLAERDRLSDEAADRWLDT